MRGGRFQKRSLPVETRGTSSVKTAARASVAVVSHYRYETARTAAASFSQVAVSCHELANCFRGGTAALRAADLYEFTQDHDDLTLLHAVWL